MWWGLGNWPPSSMTLPKLKTYGAVIAALNKHFQDSGVTSVVSVAPLQVHKAFDDWAAKMEVSAEDAAALRKDLIRHATANPGFLNRNMRVLRDYLPQEFNVRGTWTSIRKP